MARNISCKDEHNKGQLWDLTETEDIERRWQECAEEQYKKDVHDPDNDIPLLEQFKNKQISNATHYKPGPMAPFRKSKR